MAEDDLAGNLEFWTGRARHDASQDPPPRPLPSFRRRSFGPRRIRLPQPRFPSIPTRSARRNADAPEEDAPRSGRGRVRPIAAAVLLGGLAVAWLIAGHAAHGSATTDAPPPPDTFTLPTTVAPAAPTTVPVTAGCGGLGAARPEARCVLDRVDVDVRLLTRATVAAAYRRATGINPVAHTGPPACAHGVPDERAWSAPSAPISAVGRYRCRLENGRAAMWWTQGNRLVHAVAADANLAALFSWWRAHPSE